MDYDPAWNAELLGSNAVTAVENRGGKVKLVFPAIDPETVESSWLYTVKLSQ